MNTCITKTKPLERSQSLTNISSNMSQERSFSKTRFCSSTSSLVPRTHQNEDQPADWLTTKINQVILGKKFDKIDTALHELKSQAMDALDAISSAIFFASSRTKAGLTLFT